GEPRGHQVRAHQAYQNQNHHRQHCGGGDVTGGDLWEQIDGPGDGDPQNRCQGDTDEQSDQMAEHAIPLLSCGFRHGDHPQTLSSAVVVAGGPPSGVSVSTDASSSTSGGWKVV